MTTLKDVVKSAYQTAKGYAPSIKRFGRNPLHYASKKAHNAAPVMKKYGGKTAHLVEEGFEAYASSKPAIFVSGLLMAYALSKTPIGDLIVQAGQKNKEVPVAEQTVPIKKPVGYLEPMLTYARDMACATEQTGRPLEFWAALAHAESSQSHYNSDGSVKTNPTTNAKGLTQVTKVAADDLEIILNSESPKRDAVFAIAGKDVGYAHLEDPQKNFRIGAAYVSVIADENEEDEEVLFQYNYGEKGFKDRKKKLGGEKWKENVLAKKKGAKEDEYTYLSRFMTAKEQFAVELAEMDPKVREETFYCKEKPKKDVSLWNWLFGE